MAAGRVSEKQWTKQEFMDATLTALKTEYGDCDNGFFPYPWQFDLPDASNVQWRYWAVKAVVEFITKARVSRGLLEAWQRELGKAAEAYAETVDEQKGDGHE